MINETKVVNYYKQNSLTKTACKFDCSEQKIRKILASHGVYTSELNHRINEYYKNGLTKEQIAEKFNITKKAVISHIPYERGQLSRWQEEVPRSVNAIRIKKCRSK